MVTNAGDRTNLESMFGSAFCVGKMKQWTYLEELYLLVFGKEEFGSFVPMGTVFPAMFH